MFLISKIHFSSRSTKALKPKAKKAIRPKLPRFVLHQKVVDRKSKKPVDMFSKLGLFSEEFVEQVASAYQKTGAVVVRGIRAAVDKYLMNQPITCGDLPEDVAVRLQTKLFKEIAIRQKACQKQLGKNPLLQLNRHFGFFRQPATINTNAMMPHLHNGMSDLPPSIADSHVFKREPHLFGLASILYAPVKGVTGDSALYLNDLTILPGSIDSHLDQTHPNTNPGTTYFKKEALAKIQKPENTIRISQSPVDFTIAFFDNKRYAHGTGAYRQSSVEISPSRNIYTLWLRGDLSD